MKTERTVQLTANGKARLEGELAELRARRQELFQSVQDANSNNEASDSGEYEELKEDLVYAEARVRELEQVLESAEIIPEGSTDGTIALGSHITVRHADGEVENLVLVSPEEASAANGRLSTQSPVGQALLGKVQGDTVTVVTPGGETTYTIEAVS